jgi:molybdenum cofactor cytidylyltransferase
VISAVILAIEPEQSAAEPKVFLPLKGKPVLQWVLETALATNLDEIICVSRELRSVRKQIHLVDERLFWIADDNAGRGTNAGVISGLWAINPKSDGVLFLDGDQPLVRTELINALLARFRESGAWIVAPSFRGKTRNPLLFHRELFPELLRLSGKRTPRSLLRKHRRKAVLVECSDEIPFLDLNVREDFERIEELT